MRDAAIAFFSLLCQGCENWKGGAGYLVSDSIAGGLGGLFDGAGAPRVRVRCLRGTALVKGR